MFWVDRLELQLDACSSTITKNSSAFLDFIHNINYLNAVVRGTFTLRNKLVRSNKQTLINNKKPVCIMLEFMKLVHNLFVIYLCIKRAWPSIPDVNYGIANFQFQDSGIPLSSGHVLGCSGEGAMCLV